jgi:chromosome segregation ATPase
LAASQTKINIPEEKAKSHQCSLEELKRTKSELAEARTLVATVTERFTKARRDAEEAERQRAELETRQTQNRAKLARMSGKFRRAAEQCEDVEAGMGKTSILKKAAKALPWETGTNWKADAIGTAAKATTARKDPQSVVADVDCEKAF